MHKFDSLRTSSETGGSDRFGAHLVWYYRLSRDHELSEMCGSWQPVAHSFPTLAYSSTGWSRTFDSHEVSEVSGSNRFS